MRHRIVVVALAIGVIAASFPLYELVRQEYIPSDVDEAEFDVNVTAPEGASLAATDEVMRAIETDLSTTPGVRLVLSSAGGSGFGSVNQGRVYVRIAPHEERTFSFGRLWWELLQRNSPCGVPRELYTAGRHARSSSPPQQVF